MSELKVAIVGLDTSHSVELPRLTTDDAKPGMRVDGLKMVSCLRFETPFQNKEGLDKRQEQLEKWGINVTESLDECVADCDAIMIEINDPTYHLEYFKQVAELGKPIFLDKPFAADLAESREIIELARKNNIRMWSGSSLPFTPTIKTALDNLNAEVMVGHCYGALGIAPAGDSLIWYGVHSFEMLQRLMGTGAESVFAIDNDVSVVTSVKYPEGRRGVIESIRGMWKYGGRVQSVENVESFVVDSSALYYHLLREIKDFFFGAPAPISLEQSFEGMAMMTAAGESIKSGKEVEVETL